MPVELSALLRRTVDRELPFLTELSEAEACLKPAGPQSWSPKEELGHLIDSATNNHVRFVRACIEPELHGPGYAQNSWVEAHDYLNRPWSSLVDFWSMYNYFLAETINRIPAQKLSTRCFIGTGPEVSLGFLIEDYVLHLQHHVDRLLARPEVTVYPAPAPSRT